MTKPFWVDGRKKIPEKCPLNDDGQPLTAIYSPCSACMQADFCKLEVLWDWKALLEMEKLI